MIRQALPVRPLAVALAFGLSAGLVPGALAGPVSATSPEQLDDIREITLPIALDRVEDVYWSDTYGAPRSGGRSHLGVDMMGPKMVPLVAAADGEITWFRHDDTKGNNLVITDSDGWKYHYVHINNDTPGTDDGANLLEHAFAPGIERGVTVTAGQVVAYLGDSGNAEYSGSHLHFEIERPDGSPINPTPSVDAAFARRNELPELLEALGPFTSGEELFEDLFSTLVGRLPTTEEKVYVAHAILAEGLADALEPYVNSDSAAADIDRLYVAFFHRLPDLEGYKYWIERRANGLNMVEIADHFAHSGEYTERYEGLDFGDFLDQLYRDVIGREPDEEGKEYWLKRLADPEDIVSRGTIVAYFTDSPELRQIAEYRNEVVALTALINDDMPTDEQILEWQAARQSNDMAELTSQWFLNSTE